MSPEDLKPLLVPIAFFVVNAATLVFVVFGGGATLTALHTEKKAELKNVVQFREPQGAGEFRDVFAMGSEVHSAPKLLQDIEDLEGEVEREIEAPRFIVSGIFMSTGERLAYIDGKLRKEGARFDGVILEKILPNQIILRTRDATVIRKMSAPAVFTIGP